MWLWRSLWLLLKIMRCHIDNLKSLIRALDKFVDISKVSKNKTDADIYNFELVSTLGTVQAQSFVLPDTQKKQSIELEDILSKHLTGDKTIDICTLLRLLKDKIEK